MSQQKVDAYKKQKYNRKKQLQKEKRQRMIYSITGSIAAIAIVGWIGFSVYSRAQANKPVTYAEVNMDAVNDYFTTLNTGN